VGRANRPDDGSPTGVPFVAGICWAAPALGATYGRHNASVTGLIAVRHPWVGPIGPTMVLRRAFLWWPEFVGPRLRLAQPTEDTTLRQLD